MARRRRTSNQAQRNLRRSLGLNVFLVVVLIARPPLLVDIILAVACAVVVFLLGRWSAPGTPSARSLAQRNRHLERQLEATRAKLEEEMTRP